MKPPSCWIPGGQHEEGDLCAVVQRQTPDQSRRASRLLRGSAETGNCSGESLRKEVRCEYMYICVFLYCITIREFICIYDCSCAVVGSFCPCLTLTFSCFHCQISKKDAGVYEVVLKDDRGQDTSTLNLTDQGNFMQSYNNKIMKQYSKWTAYGDETLLPFKVSKTWWMKFSVLSVRRNI